MHGWTKHSENDAGRYQPLVTTSYSQVGRSARLSRKVTATCRPGPVPHISPAGGQNLGGLLPVY